MSGTGILPVIHRLEAYATKFYYEETLMDYLTKAVNHTCSVEVQTSRSIMLKRIKTGSLTKSSLCQDKGMTAQSFKEWMTRRDPFQIVRFGSITIC